MHAAVVDREKRVARLGGRALGRLAGGYDGPPVNDKFASPSDHFRYIAIDDVDTDDGMIFPQDIRFGARPSRAQYVLRTGDVLVSNVRPNRSAVALVTE